MDKTAGTIMGLACFLAALFLLFELPTGQLRPAYAQGFYAVQNASTTSAQNLVVSTAPAMFYGATCTGSSTSTLGFCEVFDANSAPADGAVNPKLCASIPVGTGAASAPTVNITTGGLPMPFQNGIVVVWSTGANCATKTTGAFVVQLQANFN